MQKVLVKFVAVVVVGVGALGVGCKAKAGTYSKLYYVKCSADYDFKNIVIEGNYVITRDEENPFWEIVRPVVAVQNGVCVLGEAVTLKCLSRTDNVYLSNPPCAVP